MVRRAARAPRRPVKLLARLRFEQGGERGGWANSFRSPTVPFSPLNNSYATTLADDGTARTAGSRGLGQAVTWQTVVAVEEVTDCTLLLVLNPADQVGPRTRGLLIVVEVSMHVTERKEGRITVWCDLVRCFSEHLVQVAAGLGRSAARPC